MSKFFRDGASRKKNVWGEVRGFCTIFLMPKEILTSLALTFSWLLRTDFTSWEMDTLGADLLSPSESFPSTAVFEFTSL